MMEEWKQYRLIDVLDTLIDYRGKTPKKTAFGVPLITAKIIKNGRIETPSEFISLNDYDSWMVRGFPKVGDVVLTTEAPLGEVAQLDDANIALAQRVVTLRGKSGVLDNTYLKYYFLSNVGHQRLKARETGTTVTGIKQSELREVIVDVPPYEIQVRISNILKSLDDKIEVNRKINENLEQQAQALFKSWFVDFEPFKNGEFIESELGMIPKGWRVGTLEEVGDVVGGGTPSKSKSEYYTDNGIAWLTPKDLSVSKDKFTSHGEIDITELGYKSSSAKLMPKGTVLFSSRAPIGYISIAKNEICTNQGFKSVVPKLAGTAFIYYFLKTSTKEIENKATGSTFKEASGSLMKSLALIIPPITIFNQFEEVIKPYFDQQELIEDESRRLAELRDTLLPKLMSGEIKVNEININ